MTNDSTLQTLLSPNKNNKLKCLGTRLGISLRRSSGSSNETDDETTPGILATFSCHPAAPSQAATDASSCTFLLVLVTDGSSTFHTRIYPSETSKVHWHEHAQSVVSSSSPPTVSEYDDTAKIQILSSLFLNDKDRIGVSYDYIRQEDDDNNDNDATNTIKLVLRETLPSGIVRILYSQVLQSTTATTTTLRSGDLDFATMVSTSLNASLADIVTLQQEKKQLSTNLWNWKDTATKLDRDWQAEKDALLHRFLELYKTSHEQLRTALAEKEQLQQQVQDTREALVQAKAAAASTSHGSKRSRSHVPTSTLFAGMPNDHDQEEFDSEMVDMLAAGRRTGTAKTTSTSSTSNPASSTNGDGDDANNDVMRRNPLTGAHEIFDATAALQDPAFLERLAGGRSTSTTANNNNTASSASNQHANTTVTARTTMDSGGNGSDDDDNDFESSANKRARLEDV